GITSASQVFTNGTPVDPARVPNPASRPMGSLRHRRRSLLHHGGSTERVNVFPCSSPGNPYTAQVITCAAQWNTGTAGRNGERAGRNPEAPKRNPGTVAAKPHAPLVITGIAQGF